MSDGHSVVPPCSASPPSLTAHYEGESLMATTERGADVRQPEMSDHHTNSVYSSSSGGVANAPSMRHLIPPHATSISHSTKLAEEQASSSSSQVSGLETASSALSIAASGPTTLSSSGGAIFQNRNGTSVTTSASGSISSFLGTSKAAKRHYKVGSAPYAHRRTGATGSSADCRSLSERCKAASTLAAELMSALMEHPPEATEIAQYRASMKTVTSSMLSTPSSAAQLQQHPVCAGTVRPEGSMHPDASTISPPTERGGPGTPSHSFLGAVLKGGAKRTSLTSLGAQLAASQARPGTAASLLRLMADTASPDDGVDAGQRSTSPAAATASKATETVSAQPSARKLLELVPGDTTAIPQLLSVLREIALSCASPGTLGKAAGGSVSVLAGSADVAHGAGGGVVGATPGSCSEAAPAAAPTAPSSHDLSAVDEEHWHRVRAHFEVVRGLVLNEHELVHALDETLGAEWRGESASLKERTYGDALVAPSASSAMSANGLCNPPTAAPSSAPGPLTASSVVPATPTPLDSEAPPLPSSTSRVLGGAGPSNASATDSSSAITLLPTATSSRNGTNHAAPVGVTSPASPGTAEGHSAHLLPSRAMLSVEQRQPERGVSSSSEAPSPVAHHRSASVNRAATASMKQLSENSSSYSPSQHVAMMLDRSTTPPSVLRTQVDGDGGLSNLPSTPLSEAAAPYQPSASLMGTSPQGGNTCASISAPFRLETREEMLRRRSAAPNAFYASISHSGATHFRCGSLSASTTPGAFAPSSLPPGVPPFALNGGTSGARSMPVSPVMSYTSPLSSLPCPYEYLLVLDFEATCEEHPPPNYLYEIIEFPVVVVDVRLQRVVAEFHRFVRPRYKRELSPFCKELTGIRQEDVDSAAPLEEVILQFERWFSHTLPPNARCMFVTDGPMDLREFMYIHSVSRQGIRFPPLFYQFIDVKQIFSCFFQCSPGKIKAMLEVLHLPFEGRLHSGLHDSRNIASIVIGLLNYGCSFCEVSLNRLPMNGLLLTGGNAKNGSGSLLLSPSIAPATSGRTRSSGAPLASFSAHHSAK